MPIRADLAREFQVPVRTAYLAIARTDSYPRIFPEVAHSRSRWLTGTTADVDLVIVAGPFRERFTSQLTVEPSSSIRAHMTGGTLRSLMMQWTFETLAPERTLVRAYLAFDPRFRIADALIQRIVDSRLPGIADRFAEEAIRLHATEGEDAGIGETR